MTLAAGKPRPPLVSVVPIPYSDEQWHTVGPLQANTGRNETGAPASTTTLPNGARPTSGGTPVLQRDWPPGSSDGDRQPANQRRWRARDEIGACYVTGGVCQWPVAVALSRRRSVPRPVEASFSISAGAHTSAQVRGWQSRNASIFESAILWTRLVSMHLGFYLRPRPPVPTSRLPAPRSRVTRVPRPVLTGARNRVYLPIQA